MRNFKRFLSLVLCLAMLMTSLSCLGGVFSVAASADDDEPTYTDIDGVTTTPGQHGTILTTDELDEMYDSNWIYVSGKTYEFDSTSYTPTSADFSDHLVETDGYVHSGDYVFVEVNTNASSQYNIGLPAVYVAHTYSFFENIYTTGSTSVQLSTSATSNTDLETYGAIMNTDNDIVSGTGVTLAYKMATQASTAYSTTNVTKSGYTQDQLNTIGLNTYAAVRSGASAIYAPTDEWTLGILYRVKDDLADGTTGSIYLPSQDTSHSFWKLPGMSTTEAGKRSANVPWCASGASKTSAINLFTGSVRYDDFGATFVIGDAPSSGDDDDIDPSLRATGNETYTDIDGDTTSAGQHGTILTTDELDSMYSSNWIYVSGKTYEFDSSDYTPASTDFRDHLVETDGYVQPGDYVFVEVNTNASSQYNIGLPAIYVAHTYSFFENIYTTGTTSVQLATSASSNTDLETYGAIMNTDNDIVSGTGVTLAYKMATQASTAYSTTNVTKSGYTQDQLNTIGLNTYAAVRSGASAIYAPTDEWTLGILYRVKDDLAVGTVGSIYLPSQDTSHSFWKLPGMTTTEAGKRSANVPWCASGASKTSAINLFTGSVRYSDFGATFVVGYPPKSDSGETTDTYTVTFYDEDGTTSLGTVTGLASGAEVASTDAPSVTAPAGKTFAGWVDADGNAVSFPMTVTANTSVYASYTNNTYTLTINYVKEDGTTAATAYTSTYAYGDTYSQASPVIEGYTADTTTVSGTISDNTTVTVTYTANTYNATFYNEDGTSVFGTTTAKYGAAVIAPSGTPTKDGATFSGWSKTVGGATVTGYGTMPIGGVSFYAVFASSTYTLTWIIDGTREEVSYAYGATIANHADPTKTGYTFAGWTWSTGTAPTTMPNQDVTATATWEAGTYNATFHLNNGEADVIVPTVYGQQIVAPATPTKTGYTFTEWTPSVGIMDAEGKEFTAVYEANLCTITWNSDTGVFYKSTQCYFNATITPPTAPEKSGYTFAGWVDADGNAPSTLTSENAVFTAVWSTGNANYTVNTYTMDTTGAYGEAVAQTLSAATGASVTAPYVVPEGFTLDADNSTLTGTVAADGSLVLTVKLARNQYDFTVTDNSGTTTTQIYYGATLTAPTAAAKYGYEFESWSPAVTGTMTTDGFATTAQYIKGSYTVAFVSEGTTVQSSSVTFEDEITAPADPTKSGATFQGWADADGNIVTFPTTLTTEGATFTAVFADITYHINVYGESTTETYMVLDGTYGQRISEPTRPTWSDGGMKFVSWKYADGTAATWPITLADADVDVYAVWEANTMYVDFYDGDSSYITGVSTTYGASVADIVAANGITPTAPSAGLEFAGWYILDQDTYTVDTSKEITDVPYADGAYIALQAYYTTAMYTVTFMNGETEVSTQRGPAGTTITAPEVAAPTGYKTTWVDAEGNAMPETITAAATYYTSFVPETYTITWVIDGVETTESYTYLSEVTAPTATKEGYSFTDWDTEVPATMPAQNLTITAQFSINDYALNITYVMADGSDAPAAASSNVTYKAAYSVASPTVEGYTPSIAVVEGTMGAAAVDVTVTYTPNKYTLTVNFVTADGTVLADAYTAQVAYNAAYSVDAAAVTGYTPAQTAVTGTMNSIDGVSVDVVYAPNAHTITWIVDGAETVVNTVFGAAIVVPENPSKEGATFDKWTPTPAATVPDSDLTYTATWLTDSHKVNVTYVMDDGTTAPAAVSKAYDYNATYSIVSPVLEGYTADVTTVTGTMGTSDVNVTVTYTANLYTVTWDVDGVTTTEQVAYGQMPVGIATPSKNGYEFNGWSPAVTAQPASAVTYTATWTESGDTPYTITTYTMATDGTYGEGVVTSKSGVTGASVDADATALESGLYYDTEHAGYNAEGTIAADGTSNFSVYIARQSYTLKFVIDTDNTVESQVLYGAAITAPEASKTGYSFDKWSPSVPATMPAGSRTFTAQYTIKSYTITWINDGVETTSTVRYNVVPTAPATSKEGYTFNGWYVTNDATETLLESIPAATADVSYTAKYTINQYTITFIVDGETYATITDDYGAAITAPADPEVRGKEFSGWSMAIPTTMPADNLTITAKFGTSSYTFTYTIDGVSKSTEYTYGATVSKIANPTKTGYTFTGWSPAWPDTMPANDLEVVAQFEINSYTITTIVDGASTDYTFEYGADVTGIENPTKEGYEFRYWNPSLPTKMDAENVTVTAIFGIKSYNVTWTIDGADTVTTAAYNSVPTAPAAAKTGYTFDGWYVTGDADETVLSAIPAMGAADAAYTAKFSINTYTVTFDLAGGNIDGSTDAVVSNVVYQGTVTAPADPVKSGYIFNGWSPAVETTMGASDVTYTAQWTQDTNYCSVKEVTRIAPASYTEFGLATYQIVVEGTPARIEIYYLDGGEYVSNWNISRYQAKVPADGNTTGLVSITDGEGAYAGKEIWVINAMIPVGDYKARAKVTSDESSWESEDFGKDFTVAYDAVADAQAPVVSLAADKTTAQRGQTVTFTVVTSADVSMIRLADTVDGTAYSSIGFSSTSIGSNYVENADGTYTWTVSFVVSYQDLEKTSEVNSYDVYYYDAETSTWISGNVPAVTVTVTKYDTTAEIHEAAGTEVDPYSVLSASAVLGRKGAYTNITVTTTSDVLKVRLTIGDKTATYTKTSTNVTYTDNGDGTATWVIGYRFTKAGTYNVLVEARGTGWDGCSNATVATTIYNTSAELAAAQA